MGSVDKQLLLDLVRRRPGIRAVEIADDLDMDLERVVEMLDQEVQQGVIEVKRVSAPLGNSIGSYRISAAAAAPVAGADSVDQQQAESGPVAAEAVEAQRSEEGTPPVPRTELAITFLKSCGEGGADIHQLRAAMRLKPNQSPSNFLTTARERGQIVVHAGRWRYLEQGDATSKRAMDVTETFRIAEWSDGVIELERGGRRLLVLSAAEREQLHAFLNRGAA